MKKTSFDIFSFILYITGLLFLLATLFLITYNLFYSTLETEKIIVILALSISLHVLFCLPATICYNAEILDNANDITIFIFAPIFAFKFMISFFKK